MNDGVVRWVRRVAWTLGLGLLCAAGYGVWWTAARTDTFHLRHVTVGGVRELTREEVAEVVAPWLGANVLSLDMEAVGQAVTGLGWVKRVEVERDLPDGLTIDVREYTPVLVVKRGTDLRYSTRKGRLFAPVSLEHFRDLPTLSVPTELEPSLLRETVQATLELVARNVAAGLGDEITGVRLDPMLGYTLELGRAAVYLGWDTSSVPVERVAAALSWLPSGRRVPAMIYAVPNSTDLVVKVPNAGNGSPVDVVIK
jgi:hypothetical protein